MNAAFGDMTSNTSYVRGKYIDYSPPSINSLFNLQPPQVCAFVDYRQEKKFIDEDMVQVTLDLFCRPEAAWVIERGLALPLKTIEFRQTLRVRTLFFVQTRGCI